eukprot:scaffold100997_cov24-Tisochrysis_lutea.AAC.1
MRERQGEGRELWVRERSEGTRESGCHKLWETGRERLFQRGERADGGWRGERDPSRSEREFSLSPLLLDAPRSLLPLLFPSTSQIHRALWDLGENLQRNVSLSVCEWGISDRERESQRESRGREEREIERGEREERGRLRSQRISQPDFLFHRECTPT